MIDLTQPDFGAVRSQLAKVGWRRFLLALHRAEERVSGERTPLLRNLDPQLLGKDLADRLRSVLADHGRLEDLLAGADATFESALERALLDHLDLDSSGLSAIGHPLANANYEGAMRRQHQQLRAGIDPAIVQDALADGALNWLGLTSRVRPGNAVVAAEPGLDDAIFSAVLQRARDRSAEGVKKILVIGDPDPGAMKALQSAGMLDRCWRVSERLPQDIARIAADDADLVLIGDLGSSLEPKELKKLVESFDEAERSPLVVLDRRRVREGWSGTRTAGEMAVQSRSTIVLARVGGELVASSGGVLDVAIVPDAEIANEARRAVVDLGRYRQSEIVRVALVLFGATSQHDQTWLVGHQRSANLDRVLAGPLREYVAEPTGDSREQWVTIRLEALLRDAWQAAHPDGHVPDVALITEQLVAALPYMTSTSLRVAPTMHPDGTNGIKLCTDHRTSRFSEALGRLESLREGWVQQWVNEPATAIQTLVTALSAQMVDLPPSRPTPRQVVASDPPRLSAFGLAFDGRAIRVTHDAAFRSAWPYVMSATSPAAVHDMVADEVAQWLGMEFRQHQGLVYGSPTAALRGALTMARHPMPRGSVIAVDPTFPHAKDETTCALLNRGSLDASKDALSVGYSGVLVPDANNGQFDLDASIALIRQHRPSVALLRTPFNVLGDSVSGDDLERLARECLRTRTALVVDNRYGPLLLHDRGNSAVKALRSFGNCFIVGSTARVSDVPEGRRRVPSANDIEMGVVFVPEQLRVAHRNECVASLDVAKGRIAAAITRAMRTSGLNEMATKAVSRQMVVRDSSISGDWSYDPNKQVIVPYGDRRPDWSAVRRHPSVSGASPIVVVGAGPIGMAIALELARIGRRVTVIDNGKGAFRAAGAQQVVFNVDPTDDLMRWTEWGVPIFDALADEAGSGVTDRLFLDAIDTDTPWTHETKRLMGTRRARLRDNIVIGERRVGDLFFPEETYVDALAWISKAIDPVKMMNFLSRRLEDLGVDVRRGTVEQSDIWNGFGAGHPVMTVVAAGEETGRLLGVRDTDGWRKGGLSFDIRSPQPVPLLSASAGDYLVSVLDEYTVRVSGLYLDNPPSGLWTPSDDHVEVVRSSAIDIITGFRANLIGSYQILDPGVLRGEALSPRAANRTVRPEGPFISNHSHPELREVVLGVGAFAGGGLTLAPGVAAHVAQCVEQRTFASTGTTIGM